MNSDHDLEEIIPEAAAGPSQEVETHDTIPTILGDSPQRAYLGHEEDTNNTTNTDRHALFDADLDEAFDGLSGPEEQRERGDDAGEQQEAGEKALDQGPAESNRPITIKTGGLELTVEGYTVTAPDSAFYFASDELSPAGVDEEQHGRVDDAIEQIRSVNTVSTPDAEAFESSTEVEVDLPQTSVESRAVSPLKSASRTRLFNQQEPQNTSQPSSPEPSSYEQATQKPVHEIANVEEEDSPRTQLSLSEVDASLDQEQLQGGADSPPDTRSRETTARLPDTPSYASRTDMDVGESSNYTPLPKYSRSAAIDTRPSEQPRTASQAVWAILRPYLAGNPLNTRNGKPEVDLVADLGVRGTSALPQAPPPTPATGVTAEQQYGESPQVDMDSLPDYESPNYSSDSPTSESSTAEPKDVICRPPSPNIHRPQRDHWRKNSLSSGVEVTENGKRQRLRSELEYNDGDKTPQWAPMPEALLLDGHLPYGAVQSKKRRGSTEPEEEPEAKRARIATTPRTPQPTPPQYDPSVPPPELGQKASQAWLEDFTSPKRVIQPVTPPVEGASPPSTKKGARKPRGPPVGMPSTSNLTWATVESLLPCSRFGQARWVRRRFWTVKEEIELRKDWSEEDESALVTSHAEALAARFLTQIYNCKLEDLFRYGLKYYTPPDANGQPTDDAFWDKLMRLLPHQIFRGRIELLRYALQFAVMLRVNLLATDQRCQHVLPFMPPWSKEEPAHITWLKELRSRYPEGSPEYEEKTQEILAASDWMTEVQVERALWSSVSPSLLRVMQYRAAEFAERYEPVEVQPIEFYHFVLTDQDLLFLDFCLTELDEEQRRNQELRAETWREIHGFPPDEDEDPEDSDSPSKNVPMEKVTVSSTFHKFWDAQSTENKLVTPEQAAVYRVEQRLAVIAYRREELIRRKIGARGENRALLDAPPFDPDPDFHLFGQVARDLNWDDHPGRKFVHPRMLPNQAGLMVVQGVYATPRTHEWHRHWVARKNGEEPQRRVRGTRRNPRRAVRKDCPSPSAAASAAGSVSSNVANRGSYVPSEDSAVARVLENVSAHRSNRLTARQSVQHTIWPREGSTVEKRANALRADFERAHAAHKDSIVEQNAGLRRPSAFYLPALRMEGNLWRKRRVGAEEE